VKDFGYATDMSGGARAATAADSVRWCAARRNRSTFSFRSRGRREMYLVDTTVVIRRSAVLEVAPLPATPHHDDPARGHRRRHRDESEAPAAAPIIIGALVASVACFRRLWLTGSGGPTAPRCPPRFRVFTAPRPPARSRCAWPTAATGVRQRVLDEKPRRSTSRAGSVTGLPAVVVTMWIWFSELDTGASLYLPDLKSAARSTRITTATATSCACCASIERTGICISSRSDR